LTDWPICFDLIKSTKRESNYSVTTK